MPKLPMYVFKRANGSYRYKRTVPKDLREVIAEATVYRQLGNSYAEAMRNLLKTPISRNFGVATYPTVTTF